MDSSPSLTSKDRRGTGGGPALGALVLIGALALGGCTAFGFGEGDTTADGRPTQSKLNRVASSALTGGNVNVHLVGSVAYVSGRVTTVIEENSVIRALRNVDGVERVESHVARNM